MTSLTNPSRAEMMCIMSKWEHEEPACDLQLVPVKVRVSTQGPSAGPPSDLEEESPTSQVTHVACVACVSVEALSLSH